MKTHPAPSHSTSLSHPIMIGNYRFTAITSRLLRIEFSLTGHFRDQNTQIVINRDFEVVNIQKQETSEAVMIESDHWVLSLYDAHTFSSVAGTLKLKEMASSWHFGEVVETLKGTSRTLDQKSGKTHLSEGVISKSGIAILDDSRSLTLDDSNWPVKDSFAEVDLYVFGYGHDYDAALRDYYRLTGRQPLIPRYVLGNIWSKYWPYHDHELLAVIHKFNELKIPLSVLVVDMDWHLTEIKGLQDYWGGWTGYTVNKEYFPDLQAFIRKVHDQGLKVTFNLHPAGGVKAYEDQYASFCQELGINPESQEPIPFASDDRSHMEAYFKILLRPYEEMGVDFWWIDWQQGATSNTTGIDPLWILNHLHFHDMAKQGPKRPLILSRWAGPGSQRYPIGFSGDAITSWESLAFQPYFTATAANIGYTLWSHDIGGHFEGISDPELYTRWIQFGIFSPIMRMHSTRSGLAAREPWRHDLGIRSIISHWLRFRHQLIPYLYTAYYHNFLSGIPAIKPLYYEYPETHHAYLAHNAYFFGSELIAWFVTQPISKVSKRASVKTWLPPGEWVDIFTKEQYNGGSFVRYLALDQMSVYAKRGAIIPLAADNLDANRNPDTLKILVVPGASGEYRLYEDDGMTDAYLDGDHFMTRFTQESTEDSLTFTIEPSKEPKGYMPQERTYLITVLNRQLKNLNPHMENQDDCFVIRVTLDMNEEYRCQVKTTMIDPNLALYRELDRFLTDWVAPLSVKETIARSFHTVSKKKTIKASYDDSVDEVQAVFEGFLARLKITSRKRSVSR
ncbi:MAG: glycoside hydrolase family 31 protein [Candidatus Izemoplasmatales bacterium]|nr:glycoside hydrolase family 31 protein [Candidatus Izemoplasmatales bacterium]